MLPNLFREKLDGLRRERKKNLDGVINLAQGFPRWEKEFRTNRQECASIIGTHQDITRTKALHHTRDAYTVVIGKEGGCLSWIQKDLDGISDSGCWLNWKGTDGTLTEAGKYLPQSHARLLDTLLKDWGAHPTIADEPLGRWKSGRSEYEKKRVGGWPIDGIRDWIKSTKALGGEL